MGNRPIDKMTYYCQHCNHVWVFSCDKMGTDKQIADWFETVQQEHLIFCETYRQIMRGDKYND